MNFLKAIEKMKTGKYEFMSCNGGGFTWEAISDGFFYNGIDNGQGEQFLEFCVITDDGKQGDVPDWTPSIDDYLSPNWTCFTAKSYLKKYKGDNK